MDESVNLQCLANTLDRYSTLKITIAAVMYVIKHKPPEFATSKEYALHLQNAFLANGTDQEIFEKTKESLFKDLLSIPLIDPNVLQLETQPESNNDDELLNDEEPDDENTFQDATNLRSNLEFIKALVNIRNTTNSKNRISAEKFQSLLSRVSQSLTQNSEGAKKEYEKQLLFDSSHINTSYSKSSDPSDCFQSLFARFLAKPSDIDKVLCSTSQESAKSQDSGYTSLSPTKQTSQQHSCVLSSDISQALRKNQTDSILAKCVQKVLQSLQARFDTEDIDENFWRPGSLLETSVNSIVSLVNCVSKTNDKNVCRDLCVTFVKTLAEAISLNGNGNARSLRCKVIRELSKSPYICRDSITSVLFQISKMKENICEKINFFGEDHFEMCGLDILVEEDSFFILYKTLKELLLVFFRRNQISRRQTTNNSKPFNICAVWKGNTVEEDADLEEKKIISEWKVCLEELNEVFSVHLTNIMFLNCECLSVLEEHTRLPDASGKG